MGMGYGKEAFNNALDAAQSPSNQTAKVIQNWQNKSPEEQVIACRELLYEGVAPVLRETLDHEQVETTIALFETTFKSIEQSSMTRGRRQSVSQS